MADILFNPRIGAVEYKVELDPETEYYGEFDQVDRTITINPKQSKLDQVDTLIHELLHAITYTYEMLPAAKSHEERLVRVYATSLTEILKDHPDILLWMHRNITAKDSETKKGSIDSGTKRQCGEIYDVE